MFVAESAEAIFDWIQDWHAGDKMDQAFTYTGSTGFLAGGSRWM